MIERILQLDYKWNISIFVECPFSCRTFVECFFDKVFFCWKYDGDLMAGFLMDWENYLGWNWLLMWLHLPNIFHGNPLKIKPWIQPENPQKTLENPRLKRIFSWTSHYCQRNLKFITFSFVRTPFNKKCLKNISREIEIKFSSGILQAY